MKVKILLFPLLTGLFISACQKEKEIQPQLTKQQESLDSSNNGDATYAGLTDSLSNKVDTIFSEQGVYAQIGVDNYWKYENLVVIYSDYPPFNKDSITKIFEEKFVGDTIYNHKQFYKRSDNAFYHSSNGEYYKIDCSNNSKCFYYKYLDENLDTGSIWFSDTIQVPGDVFIHKEISIVAKNSNREVCGIVYDEVIQVSETYIYQDPNIFDGIPFPSHYINYHYAKDFGLVKKEIKIPDNSSNVTCLVEFGVN